MEMDRIIRANRGGDKYTLRQEVDENGKPTGRTIIQSLRIPKYIVVDHTIDVINWGWYKWIVNGLFIQDAFPFLTPDEREFLITALTNEEWAELFANKLKEEE